MWVLPTYNRPQLLRRTLQLCVSTGMTTPGVILVNGGEQEAYRNLKIPPNWIIKFLPDNLGWAQGCQYVVDQYPDEPWYGFFYDDMKPITPSWDARLLKRLVEGWPIVSAVNNWHNPPRIQTAIIAGSLVREVGFLTLPKTWGCFTDDVWETLGRDTGLWRIDDGVVVETLNPHKGDYPEDDAFRSAYGPKFAEDEAIWRAFMADQYPAIRKHVVEQFQPPRPKVNLTKARLMIATPSADARLCSSYVISYSKTLRLLMQHGIDLEIHILDKCSVLPHARNRLVSNFLNSQCTHLLFIDDDMGWPDYAPLELLAHDKDVIAAAGCTKEEPPTFCVKWKPETLKYDAKTGLMRVDRVGTGFMLIARRCLERMADAYKATAYHDVRDPSEMIPEIFWSGIVDHELVGEDFAFCDRWRALGGEIWIDPSITLEHVGHKTYIGNYAEALKASDGQRSQAA